MKLLSQQIREIVEQSATSSYAIARQAGIDKSAMSRFMNGGRLTMDKLDQLGKVLGVKVTPEVSIVPEPLGKGRPSVTKEQEGSMQTTKPRLTKQMAKRAADHFAVKAHNQYFSSRRGVLHIEDLDCLVVYNNNPFNDPSIRQREMKRVQKRLKEQGIETLATGQGGDKLKNSDELYTATLVLDCGEDRMTEVADVVDRFASEAMVENRLSVADKKKG